MLDIIDESDKPVDLVRDDLWCAYQRYIIVLDIIVVVVFFPYIGIVYVRTEMRENNNPILISDPAFQPERSRQINNGVLTLNADIVHELTKVNYASARKAFVKQAQQVDIVKLAKAQARANIVAYFKIPLQVAVSPNIKVVAEF